MEDKNWKVVVNLIDIIALGIQMAPAVLTAYNKARAKIQTFIDENRNPTEQEHEELNQLINVLRESIHAPLPDLSVADGVTGGEAP